MVNKLMHVTSAFQQNKFGIRIVPDPSSPCEGAGTRLVRAEDCKDKTLAYMHTHSTHNDSVIIAIEDAQTYCTYNNYT